MSGGETAEMPGLYGAGDFDVAGFCVGAVRKRDVLPRTSAMKAGDVLIGVSSSGVHANGFSLVRKALAKFAKAQNTSISTLLDAPASSVGAGGDESLASVLLAPTRLSKSPERLETPMFSQSLLIQALSSPFAFFQQPEMSTW